MNTELFAAGILGRAQAMADEDIRAILRAVYRDTRDQDQESGVTVVDASQTLGFPSRQVIIEAGVRQAGLLSVFTTALPGSRFGFVVIYVKDGRNLVGAAEIAEVKQIFWREYDLRRGEKR